MYINTVTVITNVTIGTIKRKQQIAFRRLVTGQAPSMEVREYVGLGYLELKEWFNPKLLREMNWNNYGKIWIISHLVPLSCFDLFKEADCKLAWNYKNLIPVFSEDIHRMQDIRFSLKYLERLEKCDIVDKLISIVSKYIKEQDKYIEYNLV